MVFSKTEMIFIFTPNGIFIVIGVVTLYVKEISKNDHTI